MFVFYCYIFNKFNTFGFYSVMQSDGNSFCGDVVSESVNKTSRDEDKVLDQIDKNKCVRFIIMMILTFYNMIPKFILTLQ